jgi:hypothetical protein
MAVDGSARFLFIFNLMPLNWKSSWVTLAPAIGLLASMSACTLLDTITGKQTGSSPNTQCRKQVRAASVPLSPATASSDPSVTGFGATLREAMDNAETLCKQRGLECDSMTLQSVTHNIFGPNVRENKQVEETIDGVTYLTNVAFTTDDNTEEYLTRYAMKGNE